MAPLANPGRRLQPGVDHELSVPAYLYTFGFGRKALAPAWFLQSEARHCKLVSFVSRSHMSPAAIPQVPWQEGANGNLVMRWPCRNYRTVTRRKRWGPFSTVTKSFARIQDFILFVTTYELNAYVTPAAIARVGIDRYVLPVSEHSFQYVSVTSCFEDIDCDRVVVSPNACRRQVQGRATTKPDGYAAV